MTRQFLKISPFTHSLAYLRSEVDNSSCLIILSFPFGTVDTLKMTFQFRNEYVIGSGLPNPCFCWSGAFVIFSRFVTADPIINDSLVGTLDILLAVLFPPRPLPAAPRPRPLDAPQPLPLLILSNFYQLKSTTLRNCRFFCFTRYSSFLVVVHSYWRP